LCCCCLWCCCLCCCLVGSLVGTGVGAEGKGVAVAVQRGVGGGGLIHALIIFLSLVFVLVCSSSDNFSTTGPAGRVARSDSGEGPAATSGGQNHPYYPELHEGANQQKCSDITGNHNYLPRWTVLTAQTKNALLNRILAVATLLLNGSSRATPGLTSPG
jgi:hypothetical protein